MTDQDARALTYIARRLRTETHGCREWDDAGTYAVVAELIGQNLALAVERITRHASDPEAKTPGAIRRPFVPDAPAGERYHPPKRGEDCPRHPGQWASNCGGCRADALAATYDDEHPATPEPRPRPASPDTKTAAMAAARAALRGKEEADECRA